MLNFFRDGEIFRQSLWYLRDMAGDVSSRQVPIEMAAGTATLLAAWLELAKDPDSLGKLWRIAFRRIRRLGPAALGRNADDLIQQTWVSIWRAAVRVDEGDDSPGGRRWPVGRGVEFLPFFVQAMAGEVSNLRRSYKSKELVVVLESDVAQRLPDGTLVSPLDRADESAAPETGPSASETLDRLQAVVAEHAHAPCVLRAWRQDLDTDEVLRFCKIRKPEFYNARRFIRSRKEILIAEGYLCLRTSARS